MSAAPRTSKSVSSGSASPVSTARGNDGGRASFLWPTYFLKVLMIFPLASDVYTTIFRLPFS